MKEVDLENVARPELRKYIEREIFPQYAQNDLGHRLDHIEYVIRRSLKFAKQAGADSEMAYVVAAYHDVGHHIDAKHHEKVSGEILRNDEKLREFFSAEEIEAMAEAVEDHRSSAENEPRNIYGKIVATADKNVLMELPLKRTYAYRIYHCPNASLEEVIEESRRHLVKKYGEGGYAVEKSYFDDPDFEAHLKELRKLTNDVEKFRKEFIRVNKLERSAELSAQYEKFLEKVDPDLREYVEMEIFLEYAKNDKAHGVLHVREVVRRAFVLDEEFGLGLNPDMIFAVAVCHDRGKYIDSERHEEIAAEKFLADEKMKEFFSEEQRKMIAEAIADHRSSKEDEPRSVYGKLISSADRNTRVEMVFIRSFFVAKVRMPEEKIEDYLDFTIQRLRKRYSEENPEAMYFEDEEYQKFLMEMRELLTNKDEFKRRYVEVNQIASRENRVKDEIGVTEGLWR